MGYTAGQINDLQIATQQTWQKAVEKLTASGGYNWQCVVLTTPPPHPPLR
jgi:hypothetical protein